MPKYCKKEGCTQNVFSDNYCKKHQYLSEKYNARLKRLKEKKEIYQPKKHDEELELFFDNAEIEVSKNPFCMECGEKIPEKYIRHSISHILPKAIFKSVRANEYNYLVLGSTCGCHTDWHTFDKAKKMGVFKQGIMQYKLFKHLVKEKHRMLHLFDEALEQIEKAPI